MPWTHRQGRGSHPICLLQVSFWGILQYWACCTTVDNTYWALCNTINTKVVIINYNTLTHWFKICKQCSQIHFLVESWFKSYLFPRVKLSISQNWYRYHRTGDVSSQLDAYIDGILPKGPYPPCLRMADRALLAGYLRYSRRSLGLNKWIMKVTNFNKCNTLNSQSASLNSTL